MNASHVSSSAHEELYTVVVSALKDSDSITYGILGKDKFRNKWKHKKVQKYKNIGSLYGF